MPDQPAPDFEEARRRRAELVIEDIDADEAEMKGHLSAHQRECRGVARDFLALLNKREAREEVIEAGRRFERAYQESLGATPTEAQWERLESLQSRFIDLYTTILPATESAQAEEERPRCDYCGELGWTVEHYGRATHKEACPHRSDPWSQSYPHVAPQQLWPSQAEQPTSEAGS